MRLSTLLAVALAGCAATGPGRTETNVQASGLRYVTAITDRLE